MNSSNKIAPGLKVPALNIEVRRIHRRDLNRAFVEELAVHPDLQGRGLGAFMLEQAENLARLRRCTHIVLEVAENNPRALEFYRKRDFQKLDAAVFLAKKMATEPELLPARALKSARPVKQPTVPSDFGARPKTSRHNKLHSKAIPERST
jgi:hypothetical protein